ncbi:SDR family NAD(P)-dependent oxidoreductase [Streptomyces sp. RFCAC02]|uniref:SDR family NAD(P)-dependent oxidoreductase n=1 Tax=Streptomyces sp. RFCAC02 TaxID=2499143 RepID=UPI00101EE1F7|nr:SDR family NAD(P)-dependent oxidoreductase [Streptomyces sp. RFCAC02]
MTEPARIITPFDPDTVTAADVVAGVDLSGRRAVVTGATSGIGAETARALAAAGAEVTLAVRDTAAGARAAAGITRGTGNHRVLVAPLDLADQASVTAFTTAWDGPLHILVANAGVLAPPVTRTAEGWETHLAVNHLGHFALATGLHPALGAAGGARVITLTCAAHRLAAPDPDDLDFRAHRYDPAVAYARSKSATALFAVEAHRRWSGDRIAVNTADPGPTATRLTRWTDPDGAPGGAPARRGAATPVVLAAWPPLADIGGRYFTACSEAVPEAVAPHARDPEAARRLWDLSYDRVSTSPRG